MKYLSENKVKLSFVSFFIAYLQQFVGRGDI